MNDSITLYLPTHEEYEHQIRMYDYYTKDSYWAMIRPYFQMLLKFQNVKFEGDPKLKIEAEDLYEEIYQRRSMTRKELMRSFYYLISLNPANDATLLEYSLSHTTEKLAEKLVDQGALTLKEVFGILGWKYKEESYSYYRFEKLLNQWQTNATTTILAKNCDTFDGYIQSSIRDNYYSSSSTTKYVVPKSSLILYVLRKRNAILSVVENPLESDKDMLRYDGSDFFAVGDNLQKLISGGVIAPLKTKIGQRNIKLVENYLNLHHFPDLGKGIRPRDVYLAALSIFTFGGIKKFKVRKTLKPAEEFFKEMYSLIGYPLPELFTEIYYDHFHIRTEDYLYYQSSELTMLKGEISSLAYGASKTGNWIEYESLLTKCDEKMASLGVQFMFPRGYMAENTRTGSGAPLELSKAKEVVHRGLQRGIIEGMAALGAFDLYYDKHGNLRYLRMTPQGAWYAGYAETLEYEVKSPDNGEAIEVDQATGMILVKDPNFPYLQMLSEFAEKITATRYVITPKSLAAGCIKPKELDAKIMKLKSFVTAKPEGKIKEIINGLKSRCNPVKPTTLPGKYVLLDVDPNNLELQELISTDSRLREITLRVEGCHLLLDLNYSEEFKRILASRNFFLSSL